jgi:glycerol-3-phosphate acyltransferase PlsY
MSNQGSGASPRLTRGTAVREVLRLVVVVGLAVDVYVHFHLAPNFDGLKGTGSLAVSQGFLFRVEAVVAIVAALAVLLIRHRASAMFAFLVLAGGLAAVLLYRYVDVGAIGPLPAMYDPTWYAEKTNSAIAEGVAAVAAALLSFAPARRRRPVA